VENDEALREMGRTIGKITTAVLISLGYQLKAGQN
jgi:hypothetical protein